VTNRSVLAGDGIAYAGSKLEGGDQDHPHACNDGWVTIGQIVVDPETGEEIEEYALSLCRRCGEAMAACTRRVTCAELGK
jgi:hypothetical protein